MHMQRFALVDGVYMRLLVEIMEIGGAWQGLRSGHERENNNVHPLLLGCSHQRNDICGQQDEPKSLLVSLRRLIGHAPVVVVAVC